MEKVVVKKEQCKACYLCLKACPKESISISNYVNEKGYKTIGVNQDSCISCGSCFKICPDYVFEIL